MFSFGSELSGYVMLKIFLFIASSTYMLSIGSIKMLSYEENGAKGLKAPESNHNV